MAYELKPLPYAYDALEPTIDRKTMELHHDKHHQSYVDKYNAALEGTDFEKQTVAEVLAKLDDLPDDILTTVRNNGGGTYNHELFWDSMKPGGAREPGGSLMQAINENFGSFAEFKDAFEKAGAGQFGSGWVWLVEKDGKLAIESTANQDSPVSKGHKVLLGNDVWEHAYYLNYHNRRPEYLKEWWKVVNWDVVARRYEA